MLPELLPGQQLTRYHMNKKLTMVNLLCPENKIFEFQGETLPSMKFNKGLC